MNAQKPCPICAPFDAHTNLYFDENRIERQMKDGQKNETPLMLASNAASTLYG